MLIAFIVVDYFTASYIVGCSAIVNAALLYAVLGLVVVGIHDVKFEVRNVIGWILITAVSAATSFFFGRLFGIHRNASDTCACAFESGKLLVG